MLRRATRRLRQYELDFGTWGGSRRGAGRRITSGRPRVPHRRRPRHVARHPLHVTVRLREGLPTLRNRNVRSVVAEALAAGSDRFGFRLTQFSLQSNHVHLIAEAEDRSALSRGIKGLLVRLARRLNRLWNRTGSVVSDRYHARPLRTPREVRSGLLYVLANARHHGLPVEGIDPFSSGAWFDGWRNRLAAASRSPCVQAMTWLLAEGWRRHGPLGVEETPRVGSIQGRAEARLEWSAPRTDSGRPAQTMLTASRHPPVSGHPTSSAHPTAPRHPTASSRPFALSHLLASVRPSDQFPRIARK